MTYPVELGNGAPMTVATQIVSITNQVMNGMGIDPSPPTRMPMSPDVADKIAKQVMLHMEHLGLSVSKEQVYNEINRKGYTITVASRPPTILPFPHRPFGLMRILGMVGIGFIAYTILKKA